MNMTETPDPDHSLSLDRPALAAPAVAARGRRRVVRPPRGPGAARHRQGRAGASQRRRRRRGRPTTSAAVLSQHLTGGPARPPRPTEDLSDHPLAVELDEFCARTRVRPSEGTRRRRARRVVRRARRVRAAGVVRSPRAVRSPRRPECRARPSLPRRRSIDRHACTPTTTDRRPTSATRSRARRWLVAASGRLVIVHPAVQRVAMISLHTSPLLQPGAGDSGGMNVYVRELGLGPRPGGRSTARRSPAPIVPGCRARSSSSPAIASCTSRRVRTTCRRKRSPTSPTLFRAGVLDWIDQHEQPDVIHGNYWLSGVVGHRLKHDLGVPFVSTFHTLARVKAEGGDPEPIWRETRRGRDRAVRRCDLRELRRRGGAVPPAVRRTHRAASRSSPPVSNTPSSLPANAAGARRALVAATLDRTAPAVRRPDPAAEGSRRGGARPRRTRSARCPARHRRRGERRRGRRRERPDPGVGRRTRTPRAGALRRAATAPHPVHLLPRRRCGARAEPQRELRPRRPRGRGVRDPGGGERRRGAAQPRRRRRRPDASSRVATPSDYARAVAEILDDDALRRSMSIAAVERAKRYTWSFAAARLRRLYSDLTVRERVSCT